MTDKNKRDQNNSWSENEEQQHDIRESGVEKYVEVSESDEPKDERPSSDD